MAAPKHLRVAPMRELMRRLRRHAPLCAPVRLIQVKNPTCGGERVLGYMTTRARKRNGRVVRFRLVVEKRLPAGEKWEVILHEWAHGLDKRGRLHPKDCHDTRWGQCYSRAFQASQSC